MKHPDKAFEVVFVDDGSGDGSYTELLALHHENADLVRVVKLTRNFGQVNAVVAGMYHARGECTVTLSADGQDPPDLINDMLMAYTTEGFQIAIASRASREESQFRVLTSRLFYTLMQKLAFPQMPVGGFDFVLLGPKAKKAFMENVEAHMFFQGQILWTGFPFKRFEYVRRERTAGRSRWTLGRKVTYFIDGILSHSYVPLRCMSVLGIGVAMVGFLYALVVIGNKLFWGNAVQGWTPLMVVLLVLGGVQMLMLGIIGEYLWRTLAQARNRTPFVVESVSTR